VKVPLHYISNKIHKIVNSTTSSSLASNTNVTMNLIANETVSNKD